MKVFASCSSYVLGQLFGPVRACDMITEAVKDPRRKPPCFAVQALRELAKLSGVVMRVDGGASHIGKSRSRHFHAALESEADAWVTIDDDVTATPETLGWLLEAVDDGAPRVCIAPCLLRQGEAVNVNWSPIYHVRELSKGGGARRVLSGGFGLVAMNRSAMLAATELSPKWRDPADGLSKYAPFLEVLAGDEWIGEDVAFFTRLPSRVSVEALTSGKTMHAGHELALEAFA